MNYLSGGIESPLKFAVNIKREEIASTLQNRMRLKNDLENLEKWSGIGYNSTRSAKHNTYIGIIGLTSAN